MLWWYHSKHLLHSNICLCMSAVYISWICVKLKATQKWKKLDAVAHIKQSPEVFCKKSVLRPEACNFIRKETLGQVFSCEFCEISKNTFSIEHLRATASEVPLTPSLNWKMKSYYLGKKQNNQRRGPKSRKTLTFV